MSANHGSARALNLGAFLPESGVNGPGKRAVLWVQGCDLRCPGCYNPDFLTERPARRVEVDVAIAAVLGIDGIEGVTYSGGEPTLQAGPLGALSAALQAEGLSVMCYTGHRYEDLVARDDPDVERLLAHTDLLVDGPFVRALAPGGSWRGSSNQRLVPLSDRYAELSAHADRRGTDDVTGVELRLTPQTIIWTGVFPPELTRLVDRKMGAPVRNPVSTPEGRAP